MSTLAGAFLTKVRAEQEPEQSIRTADRLNIFIRKCEDFIIDHGEEDGTKPEHHTKVESLRQEYDGISQSNSSRCVWRVYSVLSSNTHCSACSASVHPLLTRENRPTTRKNRQLSLRSFSFLELGLGLVMNALLYTYFFSINSYNTSIHDICIVLYRIKRTAMTTGG